MLRAAALTAMLASLCVLPHAARAAEKTPYSPLSLDTIDPPPAGSLPLLQAPGGTTAIAGRVLASDNHKLAGVVVSAGSLSTRTDAEGRFLLSGVRAGEQVVKLDGRQAHPDGAGSVDYGYYEMAVTAQAGQTTGLPYVDWLPRIDHTHDVALTLPLRSKVVVTTPAIPNLELRIPAGAVLTDPDGRPVTHVGLTMISTRRPPFPLPRNVEVPIYFTAQPGGTIISSADGTWLGAQVVYPNYYHQLPRARQTFWSYKPDNGGWSIYGAGTVTQDAKQVAPEQTTRIYAFDGAMIAQNGPPCFIPFLCSLLNALSDGDPVDLGSGSFRQTQTDLLVSDVMPISVRRSYTSAETTQYAFGAGMDFDYDMHLWSEEDYTNCYLVLPGGMSIYYTRISQGTGWTDAVYSTTTPGEYYNSLITWNGDGWNLTRLDGTVLIFGDNAPLQAIQDRFGNQVTITRAGGLQTGNIVQVSSPNGRFITFAYTNSANPNVITSATDNLGRTFTYGYDPTGMMLQTVHDPDGGTTTYSWNNGQIVSVEDPRLNTFITNQYDANLRVHQQTLADNTSKYVFNYTLGTTCTPYDNISECNILQTNVTDPNTNQRVLTWDQTGYPLTDNKAVGTNVEIDTTYCRAGDTNGSACPTISGVPNDYVADYIDGLGRDTHYTYDGNANILSTTYLFGTSSATPYSFTYSPKYNLLTSTTDPLGHTTTITRPEPLEEATVVTDPLSHSTTFTYNGQGQVQTITDAMTPANTTTLGYNNGDLVSVEDPLGRTTTFSTDAIGRDIQATDPLGDTAQVVWDPIDGVHQTIDPNNALTTNNFDADGHTHSVVDALTNTTSYTYTARDQVQTRTDPKNLEDQYTQYDPNGNLLTAIDRKGQQVTYTYDQLNRISTAAYADGSTVSYTWDQGNRLTKIVDSAGNTITRFYDGLNNLQCEAPSAVTTLSRCKNAAISTTYTYDAASRRKTMTLASQANDVKYTFDNANRLTQIAQGSTVVGKQYDNDNRPLTLTLPNGITATYGFDGASELSSITYAQGATTVGTLFYTYDGASRVATRSGTLFQSVLPSAVSGAVYDADDRLCAWNTTSGSCSSPTITWDNNGNLLNDGIRGYTWDARNRLTAIGGYNTAYTYDALGRRLTSLSAGATTTYLYDFANVVQEQLGGAASANILTGLGIDDRFQRTVVATGTSSNYLTDLLGSTVGLSNSSGTTATNYAYTPFGVTTVSGTTDSNTYQFAGRENDGTGLYYNRARYYNPSWGRFVSEDPIRFNGGVNFYEYTENDPINLTDPSGNCPQCLVIPLGFGLCRLAGGCQLPDFPPATPPSVPTPAAGPPPPNCPPGAVCSDPGDKPASTPTGRRGNPMDVPRGTNQPSNIGGRDYTGHALDQMQGRGVTPTPVENAIQNGTPAPGNTPGTTVYTGDGVAAVTGSNGQVITVITK